MLLLTGPPLNFLSTKSHVNCSENSLSARGYKGILYLENLGGDQLKEAPYTYFCWLLFILSNGQIMTKFKVFSLLSEIFWGHKSYECKKYGDNATGIKHSHSWAFHQVHSQSNSFKYSDISPTLSVLSLYILSFSSIFIVTVMLAIEFPRRPTWLFSYFV